MPNYLVQTVGGTHFTGELRQNEAESEAIPGLRADGTVRVKGFTLRSAENLAWRLEQLDPDGNILAAHDFAANDGIQRLADDGETVHFYYAYTPVESWPVPFTKSYTSTWAVRNLSADSKSAGSAGEVVLFLKTCAG